MKLVGKCYGQRGLESLVVDAPSGLNKVADELGVAASGGVRVGRYFLAVHLPVCLLSQRLFSLTTTTDRVVIHVAHPGLVLECQFLPCCYDAS